EEWGAVFDRTPDGLISQRDFGGHRYGRLAHVGDRTGLEIIRTLQYKMISMHVDVFMECTVTHLLTDAGRIAGACGYRRDSGGWLVFPTKAVVLATGGFGKVWRYTSMSWESTGDGIGWRWKPAPISSTWRWSSSTRPAWCGPPAPAASSSPKACAATGACCATLRGGVSCFSTFQSSSGPKRPPAKRKPIAGIPTSATT